MEALGSTIEQFKPPQIEILPPFNDAHRQIAVRLADEGVPVRAIARSIKVSGEDVYLMLKEAMDSGFLVELPKDDWPPGSRRDNRNALAGTIIDNEDALKFACVRLLKVTRLEAIIFAFLLKRAEATKQQLHHVIEQNRPTENREATDPKMIDVIICRLRKKLKPHDATITTVWGLGYRMEQPDREKVVALLQAEGGEAHG